MLRLLAAWFAAVLARTRIEHCCLAHAESCCGALAFSMTELPDARSEARQSILFLNLHLKGSARLLNDLLRHGDSRKYRVTLMFLTGEVVDPGEVPDGVRVIAVDYFSSALWRLAGIFAITRLCWTHDFIVGYWELTPTYMALIAASLALKRPVGWVHVDLSSIFRYGMRPLVHRKMMWLFYPWLRRTIACSDSVARDLRNEFGLRNVLSIPNSLDLDRINAMACEALPPEFSQLFDCPVVISIGGLTFQKGHDVLVRAFARVKQAGYPHHLIIVGEGNERDRLQILIRELNLTDTVHLTGYVKNPYPLLKKAELFVLSSRFEGFALVLVEAMELRVPIVSTDCDSGPREVLADGECGMLVPVEDDYALAQGMIRVLSDAELARRLTALAFREAKKRDVKLWVQKFIQAIVA